MLKRLGVLLLVVTLILSFNVCVFAEELIEDKILTEQELLNIIPDTYMDLTDQSAKLSRGAFCAMLVKAAEMELIEFKEDEDLPSDVDRDSWYANQVFTLYKHDILRGIEDGSIYPERPITGIEACSLVGRALGVPEVVSSPSNVNGIHEKHWAYDLFSWLIEDKLFDADLKLFENISAEEAAKFLVKAFGKDEDAEAIIQKANELNQDIRAMRLKGQMKIKVNFIQPQEGMEALELKADSFSEISKDLKIYQNTKAQISGLEESITMEQYMDEDYIYMFMQLEQQEPQWVKIKNPVGKVLNEEFLSKQKELLEGYEDPICYKLMGKQKIDGKECYKLIFYYGQKDGTDVLEMLSSMGIQQEELLNQVSDMIEHMSMRGTIYIDAESYEVIKAENTAVLTQNDKNQPDETQIIDSMVMETSFEYYDYDADIKIEIPSDALNAKEINLAESSDSLE